MPNLLNDKPAARSVWHWNDFPSWEGTIWELLSPIVNKDIRQAFKRQPPKYVVSDDLRWLDKIIRRVTKVDADSLEFLADALLRHFTHIRATHGTRTSDVSSYYKQGIRPLDLVEKNFLAEQIFLSGEFPSLTKEDLDGAIEKMSRGAESVRAGKVYFEANETMLVEECGHYMLYGSEYVIGIAARLSGRGKPDYRQVLKKRGEPMIFRCDVPLIMLRRDLVNELAGSAIEFVFERLLNPNYCDFKHRGAGFPIYEPLPPEYIVEHVSPVIKHDPIAY